MRSLEFGFACEFSHDALKGSWNVFIYIHDLVSLGYLLKIMGDLPKRRVFNPSGSEPSIISPKARIMCSACVRHLNHLEHQPKTNKD